MDDLERMVRSGEKPRVLVQLSQQCNATYTPEGRELREKYDGHKGRVLKAKTGHGLCFLVKFPMNGEAWYQPEELSVL